MKQLLIGAILNCFFSISLSAQNDWELAKEKNGIRVYTHHKEGYDIKEFKAVTSTNKATFETICNILLNSDRGTEWIADVIEAKSIKKYSPEHTISYFKLKLPWPFDSRDMVLENENYITDSLLTIHMKGNPSLYNEQENTIRMVDVVGLWKIQKQPNETVNIEYYFVGDPEGNIPSWVVNLFIVDGPLTTITNLINLAAKE